LPAATVSQFDSEIRQMLVIPEALKHYAIGTALDLTRGNVEEAIELVANSNVLTVESKAEIAEVLRSAK
jgi:hypothetical protein